MIPETPEGVGHPEFQVPQTDRKTGSVGAGGDDDPRTRSPEDPATEAVPRIPGESELEVLANEAERLVRDGIDQAERRIRRHPIASVGIAAGVGLLLGVLLGRDR